SPAGNSPTSLSLLASASAGSGLRHFWTPALMAILCSLLALLPMGTHLTVISVGRSPTNRPSLFQRILAEWKLRIWETQGSLLLSSVSSAMFPSLGVLFAIAFISPLTTASESSLNHNLFPVSASF